VCVQSPCAHHVSPRAKQIVNVRTSREPACRAMRSPTASKKYNEASGERRPLTRRTLRPHDCQRASRKQSVNAVALCSSCAHHAPNCTAQALRAEAAKYATRCTLRSHDCQRASHKLSVHAVALCSPCAHHVPHYTAQTAAYATLARSSTRIT
jgi:hypothetical protein